MLDRLSALPSLRPLFSLRDEAVRGKGRYIQLTNWLGCISVAVSSLYVIAYVIAGHTRPMWVVVAMAVAAGCSVALNVRGYHFTARHLLLVANNLCIFTFGLWLGQASGVYLTYYSTMAYTLLLFPPTAWRHIVAAVLQPLLLLVALHYFDTPVAIFGYDAPATLIHDSNVASVLLTAVLLLATVFVFSKGILSSERLAEEALGRLDREMCLVKLLQDVAIIANNAVEFDKAVQAAMQRVMELSGWQLGRFLPYDARRWRACAFEHDVAAFSRSTWQANASTDKWCEPCRDALSSVDSLLIGVPVLVGSEVAGMMQFISPGIVPPSAEMLNNLDNIGRQLGMVEERLRAQSSVNDSHIKMIAAAKMATLGEMAGGIAHEINNPLSVIQGYLARIKKFQTLYSGAEAIEHTDEAVESINTTIMRITRIVKGLRAFARDSTNDPFEPVKVQRLVQDTLSLSAERFRSKGVELEVETLPQDLMIDCRSSQISQVLMNLLNNAMDAVLEVPARGTRRVRIGAVDAGASVEVVVSDNGPGIPDGLREKVMQPFFTTKPVGQGTGLGLSISKGIVESHNGTLDFSSRPGQTAFRVRLPKEQTLA